ncbi:MAG TPA: multicopper oxidase domain-containing protein [Thermomicrobiales bacterium]|nr:multicopper oxidase domain-containing protein [Thermomicrobiales bacterium]
MAGWTRFSRRDLLRVGATGAALAGSAGALSLLAPDAGRASTAAPEPHPGHPRATNHEHDGESHGLSMTIGEVGADAIGIDPTAYLTTFDYGTVSTLPNGQTLREYDIIAFDREIEIAPGVFFPAWTYNGQVPGPTIRCNEGDRLRLHFTNAGTHPHTIHYHGIHSAFMDGVTGIGRGQIEVGEIFTYEFDAAPYGCHLYHCHSQPLKRHIHKGLYGAFIINPDPAKHGALARERHPDHMESEKWQEFVMMMNAFDTTFDGENEVYAINSIAFEYMRHPIRVERDRPVRIYLINVTEFDPINSFHLHANFFNYYDHGTTLEPTLRTVDTIMQCQAQRGILEMSFAGFEPGQYMFHAHQTEFVELGWMSVFEVVE